jgi:ribosome-binding protein aMBF1 (putative translation factor)
MTHLEFQRRVQELSQGELARKLLYSKSVISFLETGRLVVQNVRPRLRDSLERFFNQPLERLLSPVDPEYLREQAKPNKTNCGKETFN